MNTVNSTEKTTKVLYTTTLYGQVPPKKNSKRLVRVRGWTKLIPSEAHEVWHREQSFMIRRPENGAIQKGILHATFYVRDNQRRDLSNMLESVQDLLVDCGVIEDDCWQVLQIGEIRGEIDRKCPRVELAIKNAPEYHETA